MAGSKVYLMDEPDRIWIYGNWIDFERYKMIDGYANLLEEDNQPEVVFCDTVPSCCSMIRTECLKKAGYMPEENFITWDDIEWCYRFRLAGYKVASVAASKVWHKTAGRVLTSHFSTYYYNRNRLHFFAKYIKENKIEDFTDRILEEFFTRLYGLSQKKCVNMVSALMYAFSDFLFLIRGKAEDYKIPPYDIPGNPFAAWMKENQPVRIRCKCDKKSDYLYRGLHNVLQALQDKNEVWVEFCGDLEAVDSFKKQFGSEYPDSFREFEQENPDEIQIEICSHVRDVCTYHAGEILVDEWCNVISDEQDFYYFRNYEYGKRNFFMMYRELFLHAVQKIRNEEKC